MAKNRHATSEQTIEGTLHEGGIIHVGRITLGWDGRMVRVRIAGRWDRLALDTWSGHFTAAPAAPGDVRLFQPSGGARTCQLDESRALPGPHRRTSREGNSAAPPSGGVENPKRGQATNHPLERGAGFPRPLPLLRLGPGGDYVRDIMPEDVCPNKGEGEEVLRSRRAGTQDVAQGGQP